MRVSELLQMLASILTIHGDIGVDIDDPEHGLVPLQHEHMGISGSTGEEIEFRVIVHAHELGHEEYS